MQAGIPASFLRPNLFIVTPSSSFRDFLFRSLWIPRGVSG